MLPNNLPPWLEELFNNPVVKSIDNILIESYFGNTGYDYLISILVFLGVVLGLYLFEFIILRRVKIYYSQTEDPSYVEDVVQEMDNLLNFGIIVLIAFYTSTRNLDFGNDINFVLTALLLVIISYRLLRFIFSFIDITADYRIKHSETDSKHITDFIKLIVKILVLSLILLWLLSNLGFNINALIAGFGVAGIAIGFALQNVVADLFASITIYLDKPFEVGDTIEISGKRGDIEKIGIRSTRVRSVEGHLIIVSNRVLTDEQIANYKKMTRRRETVTIGVAYNTPVDTLEQIPVWFEEVINSIEDASFDLTTISELGGSSIIFEIQYYINSIDVAVYKARKHLIYLSILKVLEKNNVAIPFPTRDINLKLDTESKSLLSKINVNSTETD